MTDPVQTVTDAIDTAKAAVAPTAAVALSWRDKLVNFASNHPKTTLILWAITLVGTGYLGFKLGHLL